MVASRLSIEMFGGIDPTRATAQRETHPALALGGSRAARFKLSYRDPLMNSPLPASSNSCPRRTDTANTDTASRCTRGSSNPPHSEASFPRIPRSPSRSSSSAPNFAAASPGLAWETGSSPVCGHPDHSPPGVSMSNPPVTTRRLAFSIVDVFAERPLEGNALAIFHDATDLSTEQMQAIARETNLSETAFILPRDPATEQARGVRVRIFTTTEELPFAGHPTLGTATWIFNHHPVFRGEQTITLQLPVGPIPVHFDTVRFDLTESSTDLGNFATMRQNDPTFGPAHRSEHLARALGLTPGDLDPVYPAQTVSTGLPFCIVPLRSLDVARRLDSLKPSPGPTLKPPAPNSSSRSPEPRLAPVQTGTLVCNGPAARIQRPAPPPVAPSPGSSSTASSGASTRPYWSRELRSSDPAASTCRLASKMAPSPTCSSGVAPSPWQLATFSCPDSRDFNISRTPHLQHSVDLPHSVANGKGKHCTHSLFHRCCQPGCPFVL